MAVYLDHAATTPIRPEVLAAYTDALGTVGNPSSIHGAGQAARDLLESGRERIAAAFGADAVEVVLTGGGTEAVNLGVKGLYWARQADADARVEGRASGRRDAPLRPRILTTRAEHHATLDAVEWLVAHEGAIVDWIPVDGEGIIRLDALEEALASPDDVALVTSLWANNEVGSVQPVAEISALATRAGVPLHLDAIAAAGSVPIDFHASGAAALSLSAHKLGAPVGIGALLVARSATVEPLLHGGSQQRARSGTMDAAGAVAFGEAAALAASELPEHAARLAALRDRLLARVAAIPGATVRGADDEAAPGASAPGTGPAVGRRRLPGNVHATFAGCEGDALLLLLDRAGIRVSTGSACQAGVPEPSHVLRAMGVPDDEARGALRFTLGWDSTDADVDAVLAALPAAVETARGAGLATRTPTRGR